MKPQDEPRIRQLISLYQKNIFALVVYLIGGDKNAAYNITVAAFVESLRSATVSTEKRFFIKLLTEAVSKSRAARVMPVVDHSDFRQLPSVKQKSLQLVKTALLALPFEARAPLLLRDQMRLPYKTVALILKISEKGIRLEINQARVQLRKKLEQVLREAG